MERDQSMEIGSYLKGRDLLINYTTSRRQKRVMLAVQS